jgi:hypothetical protein
MAWELARDTATGRGEAAIEKVPVGERAEVVAALGAQVQAFLGEAALRGACCQPEPMAWRTEVPHVEVRELAAAALDGQPVRVPERLCNACLGAALRNMTAALLDAMGAAGVPSRELPSLLDWLASRAR